VIQKVYARKSCEITQKTRREKVLNFTIWTREWGHGGKTKLELAGSETGGKVPLRIENQEGKVEERWWVPYFYPAPGGQTGGKPGSKKKKDGRACHPLRNAAPFRYQLKGTQIGKKN